MQSLRNLKDFPAGTPLLAEEVLEFHAARLLLLIHICGKQDTIDGLTKLAKLDFFARYPGFFARACAHLGKPVTPVTDSVEASMVRHHYGPWDHRYYHVLAFLEATQTVRIEKTGAAAYRFSLTELGSAIAERLAHQQSYHPLRDHMRRIRSVLGRKSGDTLKRLIYALFQKEVAERPLGEEIRG